MLTGRLARELLPDGIKVNAADLGLTATDLNGHTGHRSVDEAATIVVKRATSNAIGPTGGFFHDGHADNLSRHSW